MDLKFDEIIVDTSLAKEYLKKNKHMTELYEKYDSIVIKPTVVFDGIKFCTKQTEGLRSINLPPVIPGNFQDLASLLKQNATLISQLEYYARGISIEDTSAQLNLIIKYLECDVTKDALKDVPFQLEKFYPSNPLLFFGRILDLLMYTKTRVIITNIAPRTVPICHIFFELLHKAGFQNLIIEFISSRIYDTIKPSSPPLLTSEGEVPLGLDSGTVAIVSEDADIDSAVDVFLSASEQAPWRLRRILVQESVYQQFKNALSWKCYLKKHGNETPPSNLLCAEALTYNGKVFLIDPVDLPKDQQSEVTVEAYRTRKEMISLVQKDKTRYLSLWAKDVAEINEVTHSTKTPVIWVNNLADFRGPPQIAEAVFSYVLDSYRLIEKSEEISKLCELSQSWAKLDTETRRNILNSALDKCIVSDSENQQVYTEIRNSLSKYTMKSFVDVGKDYVCVGISKPVGVQTVRGKLLGVDESLFTLDKFKSILCGNAFFILSTYFVVDGKRTRVNTHDQTGIDIMKNAGVPVSFTKTENCTTVDLTIPDRVGDTRTRVIWTNSGTVFAN